MNRTQLRENGYLAIGTIEPSRANLFSRFFALKGIKSYSFNVTRELPYGGKMMLKQLYIKIK